MSFSGDVKDEILNNFSRDKKKCCIQAEKFGEYLTTASLKASLVEEFKEFMDISKISECCIKSILKGAFLGSGCIVDPNLDYHFEIIIKNKACAEYLFNLLSLLEFTPKLLKRKKLSTYIIYFKESEQISIFLSIVEANKSMLNFEQIRVEKNVKNNINRTINCETANLSKTINTSVRQLNAIDKLKKSGKYNNLNERLKFAANIREKYPNDSLEMLANKTNGDNKLTKSGLKHRLDKLIELSEDL